MTTFMKESRSSVIASQQVRRTGLRISQWHTCLVTCWCQLAWRHFGWNHWSAKSSSSGFLFFEIRFTIISYGDLFLFLSFFTHRYCSTARVAPSEIISGHSVCKCLQVDTQVGRDARMQPSFKLKEMARVRMFGKGGKTIGDFVRRNMPATDHPHERGGSSVWVSSLADWDVSHRRSTARVPGHLTGRKSIFKSVLEKDGQLVRAQRQNLTVVIYHTLFSHME